MINIPIERDLYNREFVESWTIVFDELRNHVRAFTPERTAEITWLDPEKIEHAAVTHATSSPACIGLGMA